MIMMEGTFLCVFEQLLMQLWFELYHAVSSLQSSKQCDEMEIAVSQKRNKLYTVWL